ncbi:hypothetical protein PQS90_20225 [Pseudomonas sp. BLCC-B13]|uniref:dCTP deaminase domain-containing protein n=1 Tax=Pseudomonas sp. BLCC-B13 TaxID=3025314 RepID=UPI00234F3A58|nr:hypothetical protein [Pseudomonas sp. BLCC-B13]MDC7827482.1 hypothetical protein [Pseudomonas sp. BLCC-B13]
MTFTNAQIELLSKGPEQLITPYNESNTRAGSYDLTIGNEYYIGSSQDESVLDTRSLSKDQSFAIPPHAVCFILLTEAIKLPPNVTAKISLRMTHIYSGLVLTSQPPFDPGYTGNVIVMVHNFSASPVYLKHGERLATIEFTKLANLPKKAKPHRSVTTLKGQLTKPLVSSLSEIASISKAAQDRVNWLSNQMLIFAALIVAVLAVPGFFSYNDLADRVNEQRDEIEELKKSIEQYKTQSQNNLEEMTDLKKIFTEYKAPPPNISPDSRPINPPVKEEKK